MTYEQTRLLIFFYHFLDISRLKKIYIYVHALVVYRLLNYTSASACMIILNPVEPEQLPKKCIYIKFYNLIAKQNQHD